MLTKAHQKLVLQAIEEALVEVYNINPAYKSVKQKEFLKLAVEKVAQLYKDKKIPSTKRRKK